jgi:hypothetical protein
MNKEIFSNISKIIERDSKSTTYKFALLRATIDLIQENSPFIEYKEDRVHLPMGLLIEKWMIYYFPIFDSIHRIPQINGTSNLAFEELMKSVVDFYKKRNRLSGFNNDLKRNGIPEELTSTIRSLGDKLYSTLRRMPMHYIGRSISSDYHSIYKPEIPKINRQFRGRIDSEFLVSSYGTFSIPKDYYDAFEILGSFIGGQDSILFKWAEFSVKASGNKLSLERVLGNLAQSPVSERDVKKSKELFQSILLKSGDTRCVWSGKKTSSIQVDHVIPFAIWKNNDLWNLLPAVPKINNSKRDKIPTPELIERQKGVILHYWELLDQTHHSRFQKEIKISLLGNESGANWKELAISQLKESCHFLIEKRGFDPWPL